jgi:hypothetical protein
MRPLLSGILLAIFLVGGVAAPVAHDIAHGLESGWHGHVEEGVAWHDEDHHEISDCDLCEAVRVALTEERVPRVSAALLAEYLSLPIEAGAVVPLLHRCPRAPPAHG